MNKRITQLLATLCFPVASFAATNITTPTVSGTWNLAGSPYKVFNDITVNAGTSLIIEPGVEVIFQGYYRMHVKGAITAEGTATSPISFYVHDTTGWYTSATTGGWNGVQVGDMTVTSDSCRFNYCKFRDYKNGFNVYKKNLHIRNSEFYHNNACMSGNVIMVSGGSATNSYTFEMSGCSVHDNIAPSLTLFLTAGIQKLHDNKFYNNTALEMAIIGGGISAIFENNEVYNNASQYGTVACGGNVVMKKNKIHHNTNYSKAAVYAYGTADIDGNLICNNYHTSGFCGYTDGGGGLHLSSNTSLTPASNINYVVRNNVIANNYSPYQGGGIRVYDSKISIVNNHIINNESLIGGGIYFLTDSFPSVVKNNLLYGNTSTVVSLNSCISGYSASGVATFSFESNYSQSTSNTVFTNLTGMGTIGDSTTNITGASPAMVSPTLTSAYTEDAVPKDFSLLATSPCIDQGDSVGALPSLVDYAGNPRVSGTSIDIGAFEYGSGTEPELVVRAATVKAIDVYPNPASNLLFVSTPNAKGTIQIQDISGKTVAQKAVTATSTSFDLYSLLRGVYFAVWNRGNNDRVIEKVILE